MSLKESYIANWKNLPKNSIKIRVAQPSILSPSKSLLKDWKEKIISWKEYERRFRIEMKGNKERLKEIGELSKKKEVYLICYEKEHPCHRFILIDLIKEEII